MSTPFRNRGRAARIGLIAMLLVLAAAPGALAATLIGQTGVPPGSTLGEFGGPYLFAQTKTAADPRYTVPANGVITAWSFCKSTPISSPPPRSMRAARCMNASASAASKLPALCAALAAS